MYEKDQRINDLYGEIDQMELEMKGNKGVGKDRVGS